EFDWQDDRAHARSNSRFLTLSQISISGISWVHEDRALRLRGISFDQTLAVMQPGIVAAQLTTTDEQQLTIGRRLKSAFDPFNILNKQIGCEVDSLIGCA